MKIWKNKEDKPFSFKELIVLRITILSGFSFTAIFNTYGDVNIL